MPDGLAEAKMTRTHAVMTGDTVLVTGDDGPNWDDAVDIAALYYEGR